jgi:chemotaxis signal transduction protein
MVYDSFLFSFHVRTKLVNLKCKFALQNDQRNLFIICAFNRNYIGIYVINLNTKR